MTVITKPCTAEKKEKGLEKPLVAGGPSVADSPGPAPNDIADVEMWLSPSARRRISTSTTVCVFITALLVMSTGIIVGVYIYRQVTQPQHMSRFRGWCGIPYERDTLHFNRQTQDRLGTNRHFFKEPDSESLFDRSDNFENLLKEEFDLDLDKEEFERIYVPDFGYGRRGQFVHDFKRNKTAIIDLTNGFCFVMPLDRESIRPPRPLFELIHKMWMHNTSPGATKIIRKTLQIEKPALSDLSAEGPHIQRFCAPFPTFRVKEISRNYLIRNKRKAESDALNFNIAEYAGEGIVEYSIAE